MERSTLRSGEDVKASIKAQDEARQQACAVFIASRAALRASPVAILFFEFDEATIKRDVTSLFTWRPTLIATVAATMPSDEIRNAAFYAPDFTVYAPDFTVYAAAATRVAATDKTAAITVFAAPAATFDAAAARAAGSPPEPPTSGLRCRAMRRCGWNMRISGMGRWPLPSRRCGPTKIHWNTIGITCAKNYLRQIRPINVGRIGRFG